MADAGKKKKKAKKDDDEEMEDAPDIRSGLPPSVELARKRVVCGAHMNYNVRNSPQTSRSPGPAAAAPDAPAARKLRRLISLLLSDGVGRLLRQLLPLRARHC